MATGRADPAGEGIACLDALAAQMHARGWSAYITTPTARLASLFVQDPQDRAECGDIIAARDATTGQWWYWFSWAERITPAHVPAAAADAIISALRRPPTTPRRQGASPADLRSGATRQLPPGLPHTASRPQAPGAPAVSRGQDHRRERSGHVRTRERPGTPEGGGIPANDAGSSPKLGPNGQREAVRPGRKRGRAS
jgi:hypothetical protein